MVQLPPPNALELHGDGLWQKESWVRFFGLTLQTRMVVLRLHDGVLAYSPSPARLDAQTRAELASIGELRWLVAPNEIHNLGLRAFQQAYPRAHTTGCVGHPQRVPGARFDLLLDADTPASEVPWAESGEVEFHVLGGNAFLHEIAVFHRPSKTLVLTDAIEVVEPAHLGGNPPGAAMRWMLRTSGLLLGQACMSPEHSMFCVDPDALEASLAALDAWDFDSMVIAHGRILKGDEARTSLRDAFGRTIAAARKRGPIRRAFWRATARVA